MSPKSHFTVIGVAVLLLAAGCAASKDEGVVEESNYTERSCPRGQYYAEEAGHCVPDDYEPEEDHACPRGQYYAEEAGGCVPDGYDPEEPG